MISFVIHTFGNERLKNLEATLKFVNAHRYELINKYIIIEQNGEYAKSLADEYDFKYYSIIDNNVVSRSFSRNMIMDILTDEYIIIHDSDLLIFDGFFERIIRKIHEGYKFIGNFKKVINLTEEQTMKIFDRYECVYFNNIDNNIIRPYDIECTCGGSNTINLQYFKAIGGYDENFVGWGFEDIDFVHRMIMYVGIDKMAIADNTLYHTYHKHTSNKSETNANKSLWEKSTKHIYNDWLQSGGIPLCQ